MLPALQVRMVELSEPQGWVVVSLPPDEEPECVALFPSLIAAAIAGLSVSALQAALAISPHCCCSLAMPSCDQLTCCACCDHAVPAVLCRAYLKGFLLQLAVITNHQNGRDSHIRQVGGVAEWRGWLLQPDRQQQGQLQL
jgi:hypothetical protein